MLDNISLLIQAPLLNIQLLLDGLFVGAIFALAAYGLALVWGVMNVKNLAQGDFVMMGGYIAWFLSTWGIHPIFGLPVAMVVMFGFGWVIYITIIYRIIYRDLFTSLLATFGLALVISQLLNLAFGPEVQVAISGFAINSFFDGMNGETFYGSIKFSKAGNNIAKPMVLRQIQNQKLNVVAPIKWASSKVDWPRT